MTKVRGYPSRSGGGYFGGRSGGGRDHGNYSSRDRYSGSRHDDYRRSYRDNNYSDRNRHGSDYKRMRAEAPSSRHDTYGGYGSSRYEPYGADRRSYTSDRHSGSVSRRDDFRRPMRSAPPQSRSPKGGYRGRMSSRGARSREFAVRRRLLPSSYAVNKRVNAGKFKIAKIRSAIARRIAQKKEKDGKDKSLTSDKEGKKENDTETKEDKTEGESSPKKETSESPKKEKDDDKLNTPFIKLECPHCKIKSRTFRKYELHLRSRTHMLQMKKIAIKQKAILRQMRLTQRNTQGEVEKDDENLSAKTNFCPLCKLIYRQDKSVHQSSEGHKNMKKFLLPNCNLCNKSFRSPMMYENHIVSIEHIMMKQTLENGEAEDDDLLNFTTIDSVGDDEEKAKKVEPEVPVNQGIEHIRIVHPHYCDLCKVYLTKGDEEETPDALEKHCQQRTHRSRFMRWKREQERLEKKKKSSEEVKEESKEKEIKSENDEAKKDKDADDDANEDKIWDEVDKDLGEIIADDEDEEDSHANGERYDRFKTCEKDEESKDDETVKDAEETATEK